MGDLIEQLPTDQNDITHQEKYILDSLFSKNINILSKVMSEFKMALVAGLLFFIFTFSFIDSIIKKLFKITENSTIMLIIIKVILFMVVFYVITNFAISRK